MSRSEIISVASAAIAFCSLLATIFFSRRAQANNRQAREQADRANEQADRANQIAMGQAETEVRGAISGARRHYEQIAESMETIRLGRKLSELDDREQEMLKAKERLLRSAVEDYLNTYEDACGKYIDGKLDRERFKKSFFSEVRNIAEAKAGPIADLMGQPTTSKFKAIWRVYREWYDLEGGG